MSLGMNHTHTFDTLSKQLTLDRQRLTLTEKRLHALEQARLPGWREALAQPVTETILDRHHLALARVQADVANAEEAYQDAVQRAKEVADIIDGLEETIQDAKAKAIDVHSLPAEVQQKILRLEYLKTVHEAEFKRLTVLENIKQLAQKIETLEHDTYKQLASLFYQHQNDEREAHLAAMEKAGEAKRQAWLDKEVTYQQQLGQFKPDEVYSHPDAVHLGVLIFQAAQSVDLMDLALKMAALHDQLEDLSKLPEPALPAAQLDRQLHYLDRLLEDVASLDGLLSHKLNLIAQQLDLQQQSLNQGIITKAQYQTNALLLSELEKQSKAMKATLNQYQALILRYQHQTRLALNSQIGKRAAIPGWDKQAWRILAYKLWEIPTALIYQVRTLRDHMNLVHARMTPIEWLRLGLAWLVWAAALVLAYRYLVVLIQILKRKQSKLSANVMYVLLKLIKRNLWGIALVGFVLIDFAMTGIPTKSYRIFVYLALVWFLFRSIIIVARLSLVETMADVSGRDVRLYYRLKWTFVVGGLITALTLLSHQLYIPYEARDVIVRLFMVFLLVLSLVLLRGRHVVPDLVSPYIDEKHIYFKHTINLLCWFLPLILLSNAIVGIIGYLQLAWVMSYYQIIILCALTFYLVLRGVLVDFIEWLAHCSIKYLKNGWLWSQAFLRPLDKVLRLGIAIATLLGLFAYFGLTLRTPFIHQVVAVVRTPFMFKGGEVSLWSILQFTITIIVVVWAGRWSREFAYRGLYARVRDQSLRNTWSIFTQYAVISFGAIMSLRILGIEVSGLAFIFGGLAVGLGFGLRDFASNIVSGIMLLLERPVREGDLVTVGEYEGRVMHIGIRSMMVRSFDNMEVMVPNAEAFNKTITNWTHQDSIVRTVIPVKVHRSDDPVKVQGLILKVLEDLPSVLDDPGPDVFLRKIDDVLIELDLRYFINLETHSRVGVQSEVLVALWETFKAHGIRAPYPQQDVRVLTTQA